MFQSINPYNNKNLFRRDFDSDNDIVAKLNHSYSAFHSWRKTPYQTRANIIKQIGQHLKANKQIYAESITLEMGKLLSESIAEIEKCALACEYYADNSEQLLDDYTSLLTKRPYKIKIEPTGVIFGIMPWNFPFWQAFRFLIPNLMLGNVCVLKHAPNVGICASHLENIFSEYLPRHVFQHLWADVSQVELIVKHDGISGTTITGSSLAGASLASISGKHLKKSVLELGGSDAFIVGTDSNLNDTVEQALKGRLQNNGQTCIASKRFIIHEAIFQEFKTQLISKTEHLQKGNPLEAIGYAGIIARPDLCKKLIDQVNSAIYEGAKPLNDIKHEENFLKPLVLEVTNASNLAFREELFGPVFAIKSFKNTKEAIELANETPFGLAASIWSHNPSFTNMLTDEIIAGSVFVNELPKSDALVPFGGTKKSGYGRELAIYGLTEFANIKTIINHTL